jgi:CRP/FNR family transcriptional regulator
MLNVETTSSAYRWPSTISKSNRPAGPANGDELWSDFGELRDLLRFDGRLSDLNDERKFRRRRLRAGQTAFTTGQAFDGLYVVRFGSLKTSMTHIDGTEHVLAFPMKGDLLGFDGVCSSSYLNEVIALTDCDLIRIPVSELFAQGRSSSDLEQLVYWAISREIVREQMTNGLSHAAKSEARVARFLRIQAERFMALGYSPVRFTLPMTRRDIGNHLNVTLETVSRAFSALDHLGIISVERREVTILSPAALRKFECESHGFRPAAVVQ